MKTVHETEKMQQARRHAEDLLWKYGLARQGWTFTWNRRRRMMGLCRYPHNGKPGRIELSVYLVERNNFATVDDTIRHEIAHALVGHAAGHGPLWKEACLLTGANPNRIGHGDMPKGRWQAVCPCCGRDHRRHRRPRVFQGWHCRRCGREAGGLTWTLRPGS
jgi:predicted SprT family Zn-dependent metalloprotease